MQDMYAMIRDCYGYYHGGLCPSVPAFLVLPFHQKDRERWFIHFLTICILGGNRHLRFLFPMIGPTLEFSSGNKQMDMMLITGTSLYTPYIIPIQIFRVCRLRLANKLTRVTPRNIFLTGDEYIVHITKIAQSCRGIYAYPSG